MQAFACKTISKAKVTSMEDLKYIQREIKVRHSGKPGTVHHPAVAVAPSLASPVLRNLLTPCETRLGPFSIGNQQTAAHIGTRCPSDRH